MIYDFKKKEIISIDSIIVSSNSKYGSTISYSSSSSNDSLINIQSVIRTKDLLWANEWKQSQFFYNKALDSKRDIHVHKSNLLLKGSYIISILAETDDEGNEIYELTIVSDYCEVISEEYKIGIYKSYYRDSKIDKLLT